MNWNLLKVFLAVCETGSQVRAAERVGLSHATVFRQITALEEEMGTRLFERIKGRYVLTDAGQEMQAIGRGIESQFDAIDRRIAGRDTGTAGTVRLTAPASFAAGPLPRFLAEFRAAHPQIKVELLVSNAVLSMADRTADVALRVADAPPGELWGRRIRLIDWAIYGAPAYIEAHGMPRAIEDLAAHRVLSPAGTLAAHPAFAALQTCDGHIASDDLPTMAALAAAGHGLALLPDDTARPDLVRCFTYSAAPPNSLWVLTHADLRGVTRVALLMGFLAKAFARDGADASARQHPAYSHSMVPGGLDVTS